MLHKTRLYGIKNENNILPNKLKIEQGKKLRKIEEIKEDRKLKKLTEGGLYDEREML